MSSPRIVAPTPTHPSLRRLPWIILLAAVLTWGCTAGPVPDTWRPELGYTSNEIHPVSIGDYGYAYVDVQVMGENIGLAFDTGNMTGLSLAPEIAERLGLEQDGTATHYHASGEVAGSSAVFRVPEMTVFGTVWRNELAHEEWRAKIAGLLGPRFVDRGRFTLDCSRLVLAVSQSAVPQKAPGNRLPMLESPLSELRDLILVEGKVNCLEVLMELDTGKSRCTVDTLLAESMGLPEVDRGYRIDELTLGEHTFSVPSAKGSSMRGISEGLSVPITVGVGIDVLSQLVFTVDFGQGIVVLEGR